MQCWIKVQYIPQHGIGADFLQNSGVRHSQNSIDDVNDSILGGQIRLDNGGVDATTFHRHGSVVADSEHVEVEILAFDQRWYLVNLEKY